jgi:hypothetical protein
VEQPAAPVEPPAAPALSAQEIKAQVRVMVDALPIGKSTREYYARWSADGSCSGWNADLLKVVARGLFLEDLERRPAVGTIFPLAGLRVVQKVEGGYLMFTGRAWGESEAPEFVLLNSTMDLPENFQFTDIGHFARYAGTYQYQAVNGFTRSTCQFDMFSDEVNGWVLERLLQKPSTKPSAGASPIAPVFIANPYWIEQAEAAAVAWLRKNPRGADSIKITGKRVAEGDEADCVVEIQYLVENTSGYPARAQCFIVKYGKVTDVAPGNGGP